MQIINIPVSASFPQDNFLYHLSSCFFVCLQDKFRLLIKQSKVKSNLIYYRHLWSVEIPKFIKYNRENLMQNLINETIVLQVISRFQSPRGLRQRKGKRKKKLKIFPTSIFLVMINDLTIQGNDVVNENVLLLQQIYVSQWWHCNW
jgi:hypothetical protein